MFDLGSGDPLRFVIGQNIGTRNHHIDEVLHHAGISALDVLRNMRDRLSLVRVEPMRNPLEQFMTGRDFKIAKEQGTVSLEDVAEFIVPMADFLDQYLPLIEIYLEVQPLPCVHVRQRRVSFYVQGTDLLQLTAGPPADVVKQYTVAHMCRLDSVGLGLYDNHVLLQVVTDGVGDLLEVFWEGDWEPPWEIREPDRSLLELIYTILGAEDLPHGIAQDLYQLYADSTFEVMRGPEGEHRMTGIWEYRVTTDGQVDTLRFMTYWTGEESYGMAIWLNGEPMHDPRERGRGGSRDPRLTALRTTT